MLKSLNKLHRQKYKQYFRCLFFPKKPLNIDYEEQWKIGIHQNIRTVHLNGEPSIQTGIEYKRIIIEELNLRIKSLQPKSVLEIGSGNGLNILSLSLLNPHILFKGIEPTEMGVKKSYDFKKNFPYEELSYLTGLSRGEIDSRMPNIEFKKQSVFDLRSNEAEMVFTCNVLVLIGERKIALAKIHDAAQKFAMFYESFEEYNNFFQRRRLKRKYTPCLKLSEVLSAGFKILLFNPPLVNKLHGQDNLLICRKAAAEKLKTNF